LGDILAKVNARSGGNSGRNDICSRSAEPAGPLAPFPITFGQTAPKGHQMNRRLFLTASAAALGFGPARAEGFEITRTDAEWKAMLTALEYKAMRREGTEPAGSSPLDKVYADGIYQCRGCSLPLYSSSAKYDSGTGWPSFYEPLANAVATKTDRRLFTVRTEVHCRRCGSHIGHVFDDGPKPTGKRYCMNGVSLVFRPA